MKNGIETWFKNQFAPVLPEEGEFETLPPEDNPEYVAPGTPSESEMEDAEDTSEVGGNEEASYGAFTPDIEHELEGITGLDADIKRSLLEAGQFIFPPDSFFYQYKTDKLIIATEEVQQHITKDLCRTRFIRHLAAMKKQQYRVSITRKYAPVVFLTMVGDTGKEVTVICTDKEFIASISKQQPLSAYVIPYTAFLAA